MAKRILFISRCPPYPLYFGDRLIVGHLGEELALRGHEIDLLAFAGREEDFSEQSAYDHDYQSVTLFTEPRRTQAEYLRRAVWPAARWPHRAEDSWSPPLWRAIEERLSATHYDAIHLFGGIQVYEMLGALGGRQAIITPYESFSLYLKRAQAQAVGLARWSVLAQAWLAGQFESWMFTPYARTVVVSEPDRVELLLHAPRLPVEVIPNGVDTYFFKPRPVKRIPALLFVGNYEYAPNVDAALHLARVIFPQVQQKLPHAKLWLVGHAPPPALQALQSESVRVTGRVPDVRSYLARAGAFISPLRFGAGIKNKVLEALAMGCPLVATPVSVDGIHVQHEREALIAADDAALVSGALRLLTDAALARSLSVAGRGLIEREYSWSKVAELYSALYDMLQP